MEGVFFNKKDFPLGKYAARRGEAWLGQARQGEGTIK